MLRNKKLLIFSNILLFIFILFFCSSVKATTYDLSDYSGKVNNSKPWCIVYNNDNENIYLIQGLRTYLGLESDFKWSSSNSDTQFYNSMGDITVYNFDKANSVFVLDKNYGLQTFSCGSNLDFVACNKDVIRPTSAYSTAVVFQQTPLTSPVHLRTGTGTGAGDSGGDNSQTGDSGNGNGNDTERTNFFTSIINSLSSWFSGLTQGVADGFSSIGEFLGNILDFLNPASENFFGKQFLNALGSILDFLNPFSENFFGTKIVNAIGDLLKSLFVPSEESIKNLRDTFNDKMGFVDKINIFINSVKDMINNITTSPSITIDVPDNDYGINEITVIDLTWYAKFKPYGDMVITGFAYIMFIWHMYNALPNILNGVSSVTSDFIKISSSDDK